MRLVQLLSHIEGFVPRVTRLSPLAWPVLLASCGGGGGTTPTVPSVVPVSIGLAPSPAFAGVGIATQLTATAAYSDGSTANVTSTVSWNSNGTSIATVGPTTGLSTGVSLGSTTIQATLGTLSASTSLTIVVNRWFTAGAMFSSGDYDTATLLPNGKVLVAGGFGPDPQALYGTELYDPVANTWSSAGSLLIASSGHTATLLSSGKVLAVGGDDPSSTHASAELYDPAANTWSAAASMNGRSGDTATLLQNGKVLQAGGAAMASEIYW